MSTEKHFPTRILILVIGVVLLGAFLYFWNTSKKSLPSPPVGEPQYIPSGSEQIEPPPQRGLLGIPSLPVPVGSFPFEPASKIIQPAEEIKK